MEKPEEAGEKKQGARGGRVPCASKARVRRQAPVRDGGKADSTRAKKIYEHRRLAPLHSPGKLIVIRVALPNVFIEREHPS